MDDRDFGMRRRAIPAWFAPAVERQVAVGGKAELLATALFSLEEPWRGRFLELVAKSALHCMRDERQPTQEEVTAWLTARPTLCQWVGLLLSKWRNSSSLP